MMLQKLDAYTKLIANLADKPNLSASDLKSYFDNSPEEIRVAFNNLIDSLESTTDSDSGADSIGATPISTSPGTVQGILEWLKAQLDSAVLGNIPPDSLKASNISVTDTDNHFVSTDVEGALNELFTNVSDGKSQVGTAITDVDPNVVVPADPTFQQLSDSIHQINTGKKWANGQATPSTSGLLSVRGLAFKPSAIILKKVGGGSNGASGSGTAVDGSIYSGFSTDVVATYQGGVATITYYSDGFDFSSSYIGTTAQHWLAFE